MQRSLYFWALHERVNAMRRIRILFVGAALLLGCSGKAKHGAEDGLAKAKKDPWEQLAHSPSWLHATSGFSGDHKQECDEVLGVMKGEAVCKNLLCSHGKALADEWVQRCPAHVPAGEAEAKTLQESFSKALEEPPTPCGEGADALLRDGCGNDGAACANKAQAWATRCAKTEATPMVLRALTRTVRRSLEDGAEFDLDLRGCEELRAWLSEGTMCAQQFACEEMMKRVDVYRARCEGLEKPTVGTAIAQMAIAAGAQQNNAGPVAVEPTPARVTASDIPVPLVEGSGGVLMVCGERATDLAKYVEARKACTGGTLTLGRVFSKVRSLEVRMANIDFPSDALVLSRFPGLLAMGEREYRDGAALKAFEADLSKAVTLTQQGSTLEGAFELFKAVSSNVGSIHRLASFRAALSARDEGLSAAMKELAKAKLAVSSRGVLASQDFVVFVNRAVSRPFGDFSPEFSVQSGAKTRAATLDTSAFMPKATAVYTEALKAVMREAQKKKIDAKVFDDAVRKGYDDAKVCGEALRNYRSTEQELLRCVFGADACDAGKQAGLIKASDDARTAVDDVFVALHLNMSGPSAAAKGEVEQAMLARECEVPPWW